MLVTSTEPRLLLIDEPTSFLHPAAVRELVAIIKRGEFSQHQVVVVTHSADVVADLEPDHVIVLKREAETCTVTEFDSAHVGAMRSATRELGADFHTVFGFEHVVFVEGPTEEDVFPLLLAAFDFPARRISFRQIPHTDDIDARRGAAVVRALKDATKETFLGAKVHVFRD